MARYSLIMKDATYVKLMEMCVKQGGISMGRLLNNIVDKAVEGEGDVLKEACHYCGEEPIYKGFMDEGKTMVLLCDGHWIDHKHELSGWREL